MFAPDASPANVCSSPARAAGRGPPRSTKLILASALLALLALPASAQVPAPPPAPATVRVSLQTSEGAIVVGCDRGEGAAERQADGLRAAGFQAHGRTVDLADTQAARAWVDWAVETLGGIDVLYNNAAATDFAPFAEMTREIWDFSIANELDLVFDVTHAAWRHLTAGGGSIINVGSVSGLVADATLGQSAHMAAKAAVVALTKQLASEGGPHGIRVNCISPGLIKTPATDDIPPPVLGYFVDRTYLRRLGTSADIVPAAIYLASDESSYMTGANMVIDGGWSTGTPLVEIDFSGE